MIAPFVNPAEFLIDLAALDTRSPEAEGTSSARVQALITAFQISPERQTLQRVGQKAVFDHFASIENPPKQHHASLGHQIRVLSKRTLSLLSSWISHSASIVPHLFSSLWPSMPSASSIVVKALVSYSIPYSTTRVSRSTSHQWSST